MNSDGIDTPSYLGHFRWETIGNSCIPCFIRNDGVNYVATRLAETRILLNFFQKFNSSFFSCVVLDSFAMTPVEIQLLDHINKEHCEGALTSKNFDINTDYSVKLDDLRQLYEFVDACDKRLDLNVAVNLETAKFGYIRIDDSSVVSYVMKNDVNYIPAFYFDDEFHLLESAETTVTGWDLAYIKFLCKISGINSSYYDVDELKVVPLDVVRSNLANDTKFDNFWPTNIVNLDMTSEPEDGASSPISWFKAPLKLTVKIPPKSSNSIKSKTTTVINGCSQQSFTSANSGNTSVSFNQLPTPPAQVACTSSSVIHRTYSTSNSMKTLTQMTCSTANMSQARKPTSHRLIAPKNKTFTPNPSNEKNSLSSASGLYVMPSSTVIYQPYSNIATNTTMTSSISNVNINQGSNVNINQGRKRSRDTSTNQNDVIDLSTPPSSPKANNEQPTNAMNFRVLEHKNLISIPDYPIRSNSPYKTQIISFKEKQIFIINLKPDDFSEALVPLIDISKSFFNTSMMNLFDKLIKFPNMKLFLGNTIQKQILRDHNKCEGTNAEIPLMLYRDFDFYFDQMTSVMRTGMY